MEYMEPIEYLIRTDEQYFGDDLFMIKKHEKQIVDLNNFNGHENNTALIKKMLSSICLCDDIRFNNQIINDDNRKIFHDIFLGLYSRSFKLNKELQAIGIKNNMSKEKYKGRKPVMVDHLKFLECLEKVYNKKMTAKDASKKLGISIDKYYRFKKQYSNDDLPFNK